LEEEEGDCGYGAFSALSQTEEAEWSKLLLTVTKGHGQSSIGMGPRH
jgi:hypothetical protein